MKNLIIIIALLISSCSYTKNEDPIYTAFLDYANAASSNENVTAYFSDSIKSKTNSDNYSQLLFYTYMTERKEHFTEINGATGCITVNGIGNNERPIVFYLEYVFINNLWLISDIDVSFLENTEGFKKQALCPKSVRVD